MSIVRFTVVLFVVSLAVSICLGQMKFHEPEILGMHNGPMIDSSMGNMMARHMMFPQWIAVTGDRGVVMLSSARILNYDNYLNLNQEAGDKIDSFTMQKIMMRMPKYPMMNYLLKGFPTGEMVKNEW